MRNPKHFVLLKGRRIPLAFACDLLSLDLGMVYARINALKLTPQQALDMGPSTRGDGVNLHTHEFTGETMSRAEWARKLNIQPQTLRKRMDNYGWTFMEAIEAVPREHKGNRAATRHVNNYDHGAR